MADYYELLGVPRDAAPGAIKKAFRKLARELHPDVNDHDPEAEGKFKRAAEAYEVLSDPERRRVYDAFGEQGLRSGGWSSRAASFGNVEEILRSFFGSDPLMGDLFGFGPRGPAPGGDVGARVEITLEEVVSGATREVSFDAVTACERCDGSGAEPGSDLITCAECDGAGQLREVTRTAFGQFVRTGACRRCGGAGRIPEQPCRECEGAGRVQSERTWDVEIPPGIEPGQRIRIAGAGHAGERGAPLGDLYVEVVVRPDERFRREGQDLVTVAELPATRAMLGGTLTVPTLDGDRDVEAPAGTQPGDAVVLERLGLPRLGADGRGDLHVLFKVVVPTELGREGKRLAEQLDDSISDD